MDIPKSQKYNNRTK